MSGAQLTLDLGHRTAFGLDDFLVAPCNAEAVGWLDRWPDWPGGALAIVGPAGCGKSHLVHVWQAAAAATRIAGRELTLADPPRLAGRPVAVEDGDRGVDEQALLHLYNLQREAGSHLLLTARAAPARWGTALRDLASRLKAMPVVAVGVPDDALLGGLLVKLLADRQLQAGPEVVQFLTARIERSFAAAEAMVAALDRLSLATRRRITVPLAAELLARVQERHEEQN